MRLMKKYLFTVITGIIYLLFISTVVIPSELSGIRDTVLVKKEFKKDANDAKKVTCILFFNNAIQSINEKKIKSNKSNKCFMCYRNAKNLKTITITIDIIDDEIIILDFQDAIKDTYDNTVKNIKIEYNPV